MSLALGSAPVRLRQRVPATVARRVGEVGRQVDERGAGDVPGEVRLPSVVAPQLPADVEDCDVRQEGAELVGSFVLRDTDLPQVRGFEAPLSVVVTGGAGQIAGPAALCGRTGLRLAGLEIALRDLDIALEYETSPDEQGRAVSGKCEYKMC